MEGGMGADDEVVVVAPPDGIFRSVYEAVQRIDVDNEKKGQHLDIQQPVSDDNHTAAAALDEANARFIVNFLQRYPKAVKKLSFKSFHSGFTRQAVEVLRTFLSETTNLQEFEVHDTNLGNEKGGRLISGLHGNESVVLLVLLNVGFGGATSGRILADLLRNNSYLKKLRCDYVFLGLEGMQILQASLHTNRTLDTLFLAHCGLGDEEALVLVDGLNGNDTLIRLGLVGNNFTSHGLTHLTRLLEMNALERLSVSHNRNPHLFDNEQNTRLFSNAISQNNKLTALLVDGCQVSGPAMSLLFHAVATNTKLQKFFVHDQVRIQGQHLDNVLKIIPTMQNLYQLRINLDFANESVLVAFHQNGSICHLFSASAAEEITAGPIMATLDRNHLLFKARHLLSQEPRHMIPLGLWSKGIAHMAHDSSTGSTAAYQILREKLVMWWLPSDGTAASTGVAVATDPVAVASGSSLNENRSLPQKDAAGNDGVEETTTNGATATSSATDNDDAAATSGTSSKKR